VPIAITRLPTPYGGDTRGMELEIPAKRDVYSQDRDRQHPVILMIEPANPDCLVPVDETIAPVVRALWGAGIATFSSCQHDGPVPAAIEMTAGNAEKLCLALDIPASGYAWNNEIAVGPLRGTVFRGRRSAMGVLSPGMGNVQVSDLPGASPGPGPARCQLPAPARPRPCPVPAPAPAPPRPAPGTMGAGESRGNPARPSIPAKEITPRTSRFPRQSRDRTGFSIPRKSISAGHSVTLNPLYPQSPCFP